MNDSAPSPTVSLCLNTHREGQLWPISFHSVLRSLVAYDPTGRNWELIVLADRVDELTRSLGTGELNAQRSRYPNLRWIEASVGDLGLSRNLAAVEARGRFLAFVDADDLVSREWITRATACAEQNPGVVLHPECNLNFGTHSAIFVHRRQEDYDLRALFFHNLWSALSFGETETYRKYPYARNDVALGFGYEDWHWNSETIRQGIRHGFVPGTCHFIRLRPASLSQDSSRNRCVIRPTTLWGSLTAADERDTADHLKPAAPGTLAADLLDADPWEIPATALPSWLNAEIVAARELEPQVITADKIINFSPFRRNLFLPALPDPLLRRIARGFDVIRFGGVSADCQSGADDLVIVDREVAHSNELSASALRAVLGHRFDSFLAMLVVQGRAREIAVHAGETGLAFLRSHPFTLRNSVKKISLHHAVAAQPGNELEDLARDFGTLLVRA